MLGRELQIQPPTLAQMAIMKRAAKVATIAGDQFDKDSSDQESLMRGLEAIAKSLDVVQSMVVGDENQEWLVDQMLARRLDVSDIIEAFDLTAEPETPAKAAKKTAKKVASPRRVRRA